MYVLMINGSPRPDGCTFTALSEVARILDGEGISCEIVHIGNRDVHGCTACGVCNKTGQC